MEKRITLLRMAAPVLGSLVFACGACAGDRAEGAAGNSAAAAFAAAAAESAAFISRVEAAAAVAGLPPELTAALAAAARDERPKFEEELSAALSGDPFLVRLVDKAYALPSDYAPEDLVALNGASYRITKNGMQLRSEAAAALERMAAAAREDGVVLVVSSAYRSYAYQETVYERNVSQLGQTAADRESARPGHSQHQLGFAVDFGSIDDSFALTASARWLELNAARFGWSLSYPRGYEALTGYRWESWHYRYVGPAAAAFIDRRFGGIQQYALAFLTAWTNHS